jgi:NAD+ synthase (glutamine-hydrolysing)
MTSEPSLMREGWVRCGDDGRGLDGMASTSIDSQMIKATNSTTADSASFHNIYAQGFVRVAVCIPRLAVADPAYNMERTLGLARKASEQGAAVALFPELGISAYTCDDLFHQQALLDAVLAALSRLVAESAALTPVILVGAPIRVGAALYNCAVVIHKGTVLGVVPKSYLPNYREFYEKRQFASGRTRTQNSVSLLGSTVPFGPDLIFEARDVLNFSLFAEICEDLWTPAPPSTFAALAGATVLANLSASNITIGKSEYRKALCGQQASRCVSAYLYCAAGPGESTTDLAWDGQALVYEESDLLAESVRFSENEHITYADVDLDRLSAERMRLTSFADSAAEHVARVAAMRHIPFELGPPAGDIGFLRTVERFPYVPSDAALRDTRCYEAYNIQVHGLVKRLQATGLQKIVIGVSGGLDSTHALIVAVRAAAHLGLPRESVIAVTMPGFATGDATKANAMALMHALAVTSREIDIRPSCLQMLADIGHPYARGEKVYDITFENVQAGERTSHLFRIANLENGLVLGTGDLSELALGWATYGVGDQMSHYNVNVSVPKTLIQYLIRWVANSGEFGADVSKTLIAVLGTEISPELVPQDGTASLQSTQQKIGPYALQDFNLYYISRYGYRPGKVAFLSEKAWSDSSRGAWPEGIADSERVAYDLSTIKSWLRVFLKRFFETSQFKRSCIPNGPKVGSGGSLSPRGDWRAPSDAVATAWLDDLERNVP